MLRFVISCVKMLKFVRKVLFSGYTQEQTAVRLATPAP
jgi:hypothetical protein